MIYMSYSNGLLKSRSSKIIEGIPGVGFKISPNGNYDMGNKKLTNLKPGTDVKANGGDSSSSPLDLNDYLKKDGSVSLTGGLSIGNNKLINLK